MSLEAFWILDYDWEDSDSNGLRPGTIFRDAERQSVPAIQGGITMRIHCAAGLPSPRFRGVRARPRTRKQHGAVAAILVASVDGGLAAAGNALNEMASAKYKGGV
jgi:hypothetical protein